MSVTRMLVILCAVSVLGGVHGDLTKKEKDDMLEAHNSRRRGVGASNMQAMVWNEELAKLAQDWANKCVKKHRPAAERVTSHGKCGENIYYRCPYRSNPRMSHVVYRWDREKWFYNVKTNKCKRFRVCGHYTQVVWHNSNKVGCGQKKCRGMNIFVCNYGPPGNYIGRRPFLKGKACSRCPSGAKCVKKLCVGGKPSPKGNKAGKKIGGTKFGHKGMPSKAVSAIRKKKCRGYCYNCGVFNKKCKCICQPGYHGWRCKYKCLDRSRYCKWVAFNPAYYCNIRNVKKPSKYWKWFQRYCPVRCKRCVQYTKRAKC